MKRHHHERGFTIGECLITFILVAILVWLAVHAAPVFSCGPSSAAQVRKVNNARQITAACSLFAADHAGVFPNGNYEPALSKNPHPEFATSAELCLSVLTEAWRVPEKVFWDRRQSTHCLPKTPNEGYGLEPGENSWDYIAGLTSTSDPTLPLIFEASAMGAGNAWPDGGSARWEEERFNWKQEVIVGYIDGTAEKVRLDENRQAKVKRGGTNVHLCLPTPGENGWPKSAMLAPATPAEGWPK